MAIKKSTKKVAKKTAKQVFVVITEVNDDGDFESDILDHKFFTSKEAARQAMFDDFNAEKTNFDNCDDTDESSDLDRCCLSANMEWSKTWNVVPLKG